MFSGFWTLFQFEHFFSPIPRAFLTDLSLYAHKQSYILSQRSVSKTDSSTPSAEMRCLRVLAGGNYRLSESDIIVGVVDLESGRWV